MGDMDQVMEWFDKMPEHDVISWSTIVAGYVQVGCFTEALNCFHNMLQTGLKPNQFTLVSALAACANLVALDQGRWIHVYFEKCEIKMNERLLASLIDIYAKCGQIEFASKVFCNEHGLRRKVWPWNALIGGFAMRGKSKGNDRGIETTEMGQHHRHMQMTIQDMVAAKQGIAVVNNREEKTLSGASR